MYVHSLRFTTLILSSTLLSFSPRLCHALQVSLDSTTPTANVPSTVDWILDLPNDPQAFGLLVRSLNGADDGNIVDFTKVVAGTKTTGTAQVVFPSMGQFIVAAVKETEVANSPSTNLDSFQIGVFKNKALVADTPSPTLQPTMTQVTTRLPTDTTPDMPDTNPPNTRPTTSSTSSTSSISELRSTSSPTPSLSSINSPSTETQSQSISATTSSPVGTSNPTSTNPSTISQTSTSSNSGFTASTTVPAPTAILTPTSIPIEKKSCQERPDCAHRRDGIILGSITAVFVVVVLFIVLIRYQRRKVRRRTENFGRQLFPNQSFLEVAEHPRLSLNLPSFFSRQRRESVGSWIGGRATPDDNEHSKGNGTGHQSLTLPK